MLANNVGLPPGVIEGLNMLNRGIITEADFALLIEQSDTRIAWGPFILQLRRMLLTVHDAVELRLRNYFTTDQQMYDYTALHGLTQQDTDLLFEVTGRPLSQHQTFIGTIRGGELGGDITDIEPAYLDSLRKSNIRPEYYNLSWAQRYNYPPFFQTVNLLKQGTIDAATATQWLTFEGYEPGAIKTVVDGVTGGTAGGKRLTVAQLKAAWREGQLTDAAVTAQLETLGYSAEQATLLLDTWKATPASGA